jgi:hypothetical protein
MNKFANWLENYTYKNWEFTPKSKRVLYGSVFIVFLGGAMGSFIMKNRK